MMFIKDFQKLVLQRILMNHEKTLEYILIVVVVYFVFFLRLDSFHIRTWDESIYAVNAYEMNFNGNYFATYCNGHPDLLHSKPLLNIWLQVLFIKVFGFNELSIRLPSAISGGLTAILLFFFMKKNFGRLWGYCSFFVLITSAGFVTFHTSRTGEMDALLTLFLFLNNIFFYKIISSEKNTNKNILLYCLFLALAFLTKSFACFLFLPAHFFFTFCI
ncbi:MAG: glycosyltransferase family 39 protein [Bacteroidota bacterium]